VGDEGQRYHVQLRSRRGMRRAWTFNLTQERLHREVVTPWLAGDVIVFGDRDWEPRASELRILRGPELGTADLAHGQGSAAAERSAANVTREVLAAARPDAARQTPEAAAAALLDDLRRLDGVSVESEEALGLVAERLRTLGLS
jgi:hypothetical protein